MADDFIQRKVVRSIKGEVMGQRLVVSEMIREPGHKVCTSNRKIHKKKQQDCVHAELY
jgi:hypothetical protein